jgi:hypothetical protein
MGWALAGRWNSPIAKEIAREISTISGLYCGPAAVGWIAAVWNNSQGQPYDYMTRLKDKGLFPNGPRPFHVDLPGFQTNLSDTLRRETNSELKLASEKLYRYGTIHHAMEQHEMPIIVRMPASKLIDGLHYVTLYSSERCQEQGGSDEIQFYWQDNGLYKGSEGVTTGLSKTAWRRVGMNMFFWGATRVVKV